MKESRSPTLQVKFPDYLDLGTARVFLGAVFRAVTFFFVTGLLPKVGDWLVLWFLNSHPNDPVM